MELNLIPSPQNLISADDTRFLEIESVLYQLLLPQEDERLLHTAKACFPQCCAQITESDYYALLPSGAPLEPMQAKRMQEYCDSYYLRITRQGATLYAPTPQGFFYGLQTLGKLLKLYNGRLPMCELADWADTAVRCEYLEFRNFYPTFAHVLDYIRQMAMVHINALIVEFEDKRPFPNFPFLQDNVHGFSSSEIEELVQTAHNYFIQLIPLQQTFGHLEYVLKHPQYHSLRELPKSAGELCPQKDGSVQLAQALLSDIVSLFPHARYLHLGCDEVWSLGQCSTCAVTGLTRSQLFIHYVNKLIDASCRMGKTPLLWHDMITACTAEELEELDKRAIVIVWMYDRNDILFRAGKMLDKLRKAGITTWGGCSVRCWDGCGEQNYPLLNCRRKNIEFWSQLAQRYKLSGIVNTNWSAYSALASPYGVYETSFYPGFFAAGCAWNRKESAASFLGRFLQLYHGVQDLHVLEEGWQFEDYFSLLPRLLPQIVHGQELGNLIQAVAQYERAVYAEFPASLQVFRVVMHPERREEWESLQNRYIHTFSLLQEVRPQLQHALEVFLAPDMVQEYLCARFYNWEMLEREILHLAQAKSPVSFQPILTKGHTYPIEEK